MRYRTGIHDVEFIGYHGVYAEEKRIGSKFLVDAELDMEMSDGEMLIHLRDVLNYETLFEIISGEMQQPHSLIETVAANILARINTTWPLVRRAEVRIRKLDPGGSFKSGCAFASLGRDFI